MKLILSPQETIDCLQQLNSERQDVKKCKMCGREFMMAHNEDEDNAAEMECIKEHGRCLECYEEYGEDGYADR